jgi:hypothetical protein
MWPFTRKRIGFTDADGVYKIKLSRSGFRRNHDMAMAFAMMLDENAKRLGRPDLAVHAEHQKKLKDYAERGEPVPAQWLDPSIGTFRADSNGQPAKYPASENRG